MNNQAELQKAVAFLEAGDWQAAHPIAHDDLSPLGCWAHGIVHILEGDLWNARYWYGRARREFPGQDAAPREIAELKEAVAKTSA
ncbi:MAG TPA: hypothetical protein VJU83_08240 [Burkholderiales bacterium]|nr:hypothetical protein [Burkholderiales bacterium]